MSLTPNERARLQARSGCAATTIRKWLDGEGVREASRLRLERAAREEGIALPAALQAAAPSGART